MINYKKILVEAIKENPNADKWDGATYEDIKRVSNTAVGKVGQTFVRKLCEETNFSCTPPYTKNGDEAYNSPWDLKIENITFEIKTASEDTGGSFQFNHVRLHRPYDALLCVGIAPNEIFFNLWTKADVATGGAGTLTSMEQGGASDFKLSKRRSQMRCITEFAEVLNEFLCTKFPDKTTCNLKG